MRDVMDVAKYVIDFCTRIDNPISNLQLQKILYYIQLNFYRNFHISCFEENLFEAWEYGPVVPAVYYSFNSYGATKICNIYNDVNSLFDANEESFCKNIIMACISLDVWELVQRSHKKGSPWDQVHAEHQVQIPEALIKEYAHSAQ